MWDYNSITCPVVIFVRTHGTVIVVSSFPCAGGRCWAFSWAANVSR